MRVEQIRPILRRCGSAAAAGDGPEIVGDEAGAADEGAVDLGEAKDLGGVFRVDRAAVKDARRRRQAAADRPVHRRDVATGRGAAGADRPDRLVGDDEAVERRAIRQRALELAGNGCDRVPGVALGQRLADAEDRHEADALRREDLGADLGIGLAVPPATLGMSEDDIGAAGIGQHFGADVAGIGALRLGMAVLAAERDAAAGEHGMDGGKQCRRRAEEKLAGKPTRHSPGAPRQCVGARDPVGAQAVHLPVAGDKLPPIGHPRSPGKGTAAAILAAAAASIYFIGDATITSASAPVNPARRRQEGVFAMLQAIRSKAGSLVVKGLFAILIVTFGIWGIGDIFRDRGQSTVVATVDGASIGAGALEEALRPAIERMQMQTGTPVDFSQAKKLGVLDEVLGELINESLTQAEAARLKLDVSDAVLRGAILDNPNFRGPNGVFDRSAFNAVLAANHLTEDQYVAELKREIPRSDLLRALSFAAAAPPAMVDRLYRYRAEERIADIVSLKAAAAGDVGQPSEAELKAYYDAHQETFRAPEYRAVTIESLSPSELAQHILVPQAKLEEEYAERQGEFVTPERRDIEQILAPSEAKAKAAAAALAAGKDWREVATTIAGQNPDTIDLGLMTRGELPRELAAAAFSLPLNKASAPIRSPLGWHILRVARIEPPQAQSFAEARSKLAAKVAYGEAVDHIYKIADQVDDALAGGASLGEAGTKFGLKKTVVAAIDERGLGPDGKPPALPIAPADVAKLAFATDEGQLSRVTETGDNTLYVLRTDKVIPPSIKPLSAVTPAATAAWQAEKRAAAVAAEAAALARSVTPGTRLVTSANVKGLKVETSAPLLRSGSAGAPVPPALIAKLFAAHPGGVVTATDAQGAYVAQLDTIQVPDKGPAAKAELKQELDAELQFDLGSEFTRGLRLRFPVEVHREVLDRMF
jgi:peptidyl-prolyl cis-trans isomerase D